MPDDEKDDPYSKVAAVDDDACDVLIRVDVGTLVFHFTHMRGMGHKLDTICEVEYRREALQNSPRFTAHLDALSLSNQESFRRRLDEFFNTGKGVAWQVVVNRACFLARRYLLEFVHSEGVEDFEDEIPETAPRYLVRPLLPNDGVTVIFGPGGAGKGYFTLALATCLSYGIEMTGLDVADIGDRSILYLDYEDTLETFKRRLRQIAFGMDVMPPPSVRRVPGRGVPLADRIEALGGLIKRERAALLVVDSAVPACGGSPNDPEQVAGFFRAFQRFAIPGIVIAHETKDGGDAHPFGSVFWSNLARSTINVRSETSGESALELILRNRKRNDDRPFKPIAFRLEWEQDDAGRTKAFRLGRIRQEEITTAISHLVPLWERLRSLLVRKPWQTVAELAEAVEEEPRAVQQCLQRSHGAFTSHEGAAGVTTWASVYSLPMEGLA